MNANLNLWILQLILAVIFLTTGLQKLLLKGKSLEKFVPVSKDFSPRRVRMIGVMELLAAAGVTIPYYTNVFPILTPLAALGMILMMIGAMAYHVPRKQILFVVFNLLVGLAAGIVTHGRW